MTDIYFGMWEIQVEKLHGCFLFFLNKTKHQTDLLNNREKEFKLASLFMLPPPQPKTIV